MRRAALLLAAALSLSPAPAARAAGPALQVRAALSPAAPLFADTVEGRVEVAVDPAAIDPDAIEVRPDFSPYAATAEPSRSSREQGGRALVVLRYRLVCLTEECLPGARPRRLELPGGEVRARGRDGKELRAPIVLPPLEVRGRARASDVGRTELPFRASTSLPAPSYRLAPGPFSDALLAAAALLALGGAVLVWPRRRRDPRPLARPEGLPRALRLLRESLTRREPDRRKALDLASRELDRSGRAELAGSARRFAWSADGPTPPRIEGLVRDAERVEERP